KKKLPKKKKQTFNYLHINYFHKTGIKNKIENIYFPSTNFQKLCPKKGPNKKKKILPN
ncbi:hypothetical protein Leryth_023464, partial [Lithospermum erythrorhizon]